jgi:hypothetical protein
MKTMWCWRCKAELPMLDEEEWSRILPLLSMDIAAIKSYRTQHGASLSEALRAAQLPGREEFERITGYREANPNAIWHHRASLYGPPCKHCGKPLRSPLAKHCAACGRTRTD